MLKSKSRGDHGVNLAIAFATRHYRPLPRSLACGNRIPLIASAMAGDPPTVGMHLDSAIAGLQNVSTPQLYATVIAVSLAFSFYLLNSGGGSSSLAMMDKDKSSTEGVADSLHKPKKKQHQHQGTSSSTPEPKWHILKITNYVAALGFLLSVLQFASNATTYLNDSTSLLQFLGVWSVFLCYFFGFFGISFIELDDFVDQQQQPPQPSEQQAVAPARKLRAPER